KRGNPVLWGAQHFPRLLQLSGDQGARGLFRDLADQIVEVEMPGDAVLVDIDTQAALDSVRFRFEQAEVTQSDPRPSGGTGYCHWVVARCRPHAQHLRG
ncbi:MAG: nucleotidyltransferase family protein, partial [Gammaproteobacteria bacterium]